MRNEKGEACRCWPGPRTFTSSTSTSCSACGGVRANDGVLRISAASRCCCVHGRRSMGSSSSESKASSSAWKEKTTLPNNLAHARSCRQGASPESPITSNLPPSILCPPIESSRWLSTLASHCSHDVVPVYLSCIICTTPLTSPIPHSRLQPYYVTYITYLTCHLQIPKAPFSCFWAFAYVVPSACHGLSQFFVWLTPVYPSSRK